MSGLLGKLEHGAEEVGEALERGAEGVVHGLEHEAGLLLGADPFHSLLLNLFKHLGQEMEPELAEFAPQITSLFNLLETHNPQLAAELKKSVFDVLKLFLPFITEGIQKILTYLKPFVFALLLNFTNNAALKPSEKRVGGIKCFAVPPGEAKPSIVPKRVAAVQLPDSGANGYAPLEFIVAGEGGQAGITRRLVELLEDAFYCYLPDVTRQIPKDLLSAELAFIRKGLAPDQIWDDELAQYDHLSQNPLQFTIDFFLKGVGVTTLVAEGNHRVSFSSFTERVTFVSDGKGNVTPEFYPDSSPQTLLRLRSRAFNQVTLIDHLLNVHEVYSSYLAQANVYLPRDSPLSKFLAPHVFGSLIKDSAAYANLFNQTGLLVEATTTTFEAILASFAQARIRANGYDLWPTWYANAQANNILKDLLYTKRGQLYWRHLSQYVQAGVTETGLAAKYPLFWKIMKSIYSENANLDDTDATVKLLLTEGIFRVSYYHYQVGNAYPYSFNPDIYHWDFSDEATIGAIWSSATALATSSRQLQLVTLSADAWFPNASGPWKAFVSGLVQDAAVAEPETEQNRYVASTTDAGEEVGRYPSWIWELEPSVAR